MTARPTSTTEPLRILTVLAHPDDESFGPAAMLAKYVAAGAQVHGIWFTRGEHGQANVTPLPSPAALADLREQDLRDAASIIGYTSLDILRYADGGLADLAPELMESHVRDAIEQFEPQVVFTFGPAGISRHPDHLAVHRAAVAAFHAARQLGRGVRALYYDAVPPVVAKMLGIEEELDGNPNTFIDVAAFQQVKLDALRCHARHIVDAQLMVERITAQPQTAFTMYRVFPPVPADSVMTELC